MLKVSKTNVLVALFLITTVYSTIFFAQPPVEADKVPETKPEVTRLIEKIKEECGKLEVSYPIKTEELKTKESRAFVQVAIQNALSEFIDDNTIVSISDRDIYTTAIIRKPSQKDLWTVEAYKSAMRRYDASVKYLSNFESVLEEAIKQVFVEKMNLRYDIEKTDSDDTKSLSSIDMLYSRDLLSQQRLNYRNLWSRIINILNESNVTVSEDVSTKDKYSLKANLKPHTDENWIYQSFTSISMWDPYAQSTQESGNYVNIEVRYIVRRRKQGGAFQNYINTSTPEEDFALKTIIRKLKNP